MQDPGEYPLSYKRKFTCAYDTEFAALKALIATLCRDYIIIPLPTTERVHQDKAQGSSRLALSPSLSTNAGSVYSNLPLGGPVRVAPHRVWSTVLSHEAWQ